MGNGRVPGPICEGDLNRTYQSRGPLNSEEQYCVAVDNQRDMGVVRVVELPLNIRAAERANVEFYRRHPKLVVRGKHQALDICNPSHDLLRKDWIDLYERYGGKVNRSSTVHDCAPMPQPAFVSLYVGSKIVGKTINIMLKDHGTIIISENITPNSHVLWELPEVGKTYRLTAHWTGEVKNDEASLALVKITEELRLLDKEYKHWKGWYNHKEHWAIGIVKHFSPEPYGVDPSGFEQQFEDEEKERYLERMQAIKRYKQKVNKMKQQIVDLTAFSNDEVTAVRGQIQEVTLELQRTPDYRSLLKATPRIFKK